MHQERAVSDSNLPVGNLVAVITSRGSRQDQDQAIVGGTMIFYEDHLQSLVLMAKDMLSLMPEFCKEFDTQKLTIPLYWLREDKIMEFQKCSKCQCRYP